ncbi:TetR/AcrR family transcriptional regulator [Nitratireductor arenosus]|nr:TetR/AcrR family transcriptional regulator [Nitratireductor arenosus]
MPRQPRARQTRAALIEATEILVAREGEAAVTTSRVAAACGVAVGSVYRYFADRDALLLAAYDDTVARIVAACAAALERLDPTTPVDVAARMMLEHYLTAADAVPAHVGLLRVMRRLRPVEHDQGQAENRIVGDLLGPFLARFAPAIPTPDPHALAFLNALLGTLVDLYLVEDRADIRLRLRDDIEAHMVLALGRILAGAPDEDGN